MGHNFKGYTLIEIMVVMVLMTIAFSVVITNTVNTDGMSLRSAQRIISSVAQGARGQAIMKQSPSRIIIYADKSESADRNKYLRYVGIVTQDPENPKKWIAGTEGTFLPKGVYFRPDLSNLVNSGGKQIGKMYINYPRIKPQINNKRLGEEYYYYEFNANGTMGSKFVNSWLIFGAGSLRNKGSQEIDISFDKPSHEGLKSGLIFRKAGSTTLVTDPNQIDKLASRAD